MSDRKLIIFDFDGVLADSFDTFYPLIKDSMKHIGLSLTPNQYRGFFTGSVHQGFKDFINDNQKYLIFSEFRKVNYDRNYYNKEGGVKLFSEAPAFLKKIGKKYILTIASSGKQENIKNLLKEKRVDNFFSMILADSNYSKNKMIKEILSTFQVQPSETIMITDTIGDILIAKKFGLQTIGVTWGFHSIKTLKFAKPDHIANNFKILYKTIKAF